MACRKSPAAFCGLNSVGPARMLHAGITRDGLFQALGRNDREKRISDLMVRNFEIVESKDGLASALERMQGSASATLAGNRNGRLVGLLTAENVAEYLIIKTALTGGEFAGIPHFAAAK